MNDTDKKKIEEFKENIIKYVKEIEIDENGRLNKGLIFIPVTGAVPEQPMIFGFVDPTLFGLKMSLLKDKLTEDETMMKIMESTKDPTERERLIRAMKK